MCANPVLHPDTFCCAIRLNADHRVKTYVHVQTLTEVEHGWVEMLVGMQMVFAINKTKFLDRNMKREIWSSCF
jgi:hypothetical protein